MSHRHAHKSRRGGDRASRDDIGERLEKSNGAGGGGGGGGRDRDRERDRGRDYRRYRSRSPVRRDNKDRDDERPRDRDRAGHDRDKKHRERERERERTKHERNERPARPQHRRDRDAESPSSQTKDRGTTERTRVRDRDEETIAAPRGSEKFRASRDGIAEEEARTSRIGSGKASRRRSASPRRSPSPCRTGRDGHDKELGEELGVGASLPSRSRSDKLGAPNTAPVSFKVKGHDRRDGSRGDDRGSSRDRDGDYRGRRGDDEDSRGRFGDDPMEEDDEEEPVVDDDGMAAMQAMLGFGGFDSTKGKKIIGNNVGGVRKEKTTEYRQYMNRVGGFNRPLSPTG